MERPAAGADVAPAASTASPISTARPNDQGAVDFIRHAERLIVSTERVPAERVRLIRRIVTETRMIPVEVRREVLEVERTPIDVDDTRGGQFDLGPAASTTMLLREEVPVVTIEVRVSERIVMSVIEVAGQTTVRAEVSSEQLEVVDVPAMAPPA